MTIDIQQPMAEPWRYPREEWVGLAAYRAAAALPLPPLAEARRLADEAEALRLAYWTEHLRPWAEREVGRYRRGYDVRAIPKYREMEAEARRLQNIADVTFSIARGNWRSIYNPSGREAGLDAEAFRLALVDAADEHEAAVYRAVRDGCPVPLWARKDYLGLERPEESGR